jgi:signal transduction histidine kinase
LVDDLFLLSRIDAGSISIASEPVDVTELADEAIEVLRPVAHRAGVSLRLEADHRTVVPGGTEAVSRAMRNLIENAIRHAPTGSEVVVEVRSGTGATVRVLDQGPGFDPGFVDHAFDRFTRADDARSRDTGGSGLGLAIARGFVDALGGEIWAEPGPGGTVTFHLPAG